MASAALLVGGASSARAQDERIASKVPFAFMVGRTELPAGSYEVRQAYADPAIVSIVSEDGRDVAVAITIAGGAAVPTSGSSLVFRKFGDEYFLERVVSTGGTGRDIVLTPRRMERDLALRSASGSATAAEDGR
jgi:hypothetical protein